MKPAATYWKPISEFDRSKLWYGLVFESGAMRARVWNDRKQQWERSEPFACPLQIGDECHDPTHFMELPESPQ